jgi:hypothetical protein
MLQESTNTPEFLPSPTCGRGLGRGLGRGRFAQQEQLLLSLWSYLCYKLEKVIPAFLYPCKPTANKPCAGAG